MGIYREIKSCLTVYRDQTPDPYARRFPLADCDGVTIGVYNNAGGEYVIDEIVIPTPHEAQPYLTIRRPQGKHEGHPLFEVLDALIDKRHIEESLQVAMDEAEA